MVRAVDGARAELTNQAMGNVRNLVMTGQALVQVESPINRSDCANRY